MELLNKIAGYLKTHICWSTRNWLIISALVDNRFFDREDSGTSDFKGKEKKGISKNNSAFMTSLRSPSSPFIFMKLNYKWYKLYFNFKKWRKTKYLVENEYVFSQLKLLLSFSSFTRFKSLFLLAKRRKIF